MAMDDRKQRILLEIVSLYARGEPVGSSLLSRHFDMAVSSATLRNEMAALTRLGLLEQPHTSAGSGAHRKGLPVLCRPPAGSGFQLCEADRRHMDMVFPRAGQRSEKACPGAARL